MRKSIFHGAFVLNRRVDLHAIDATVDFHTGVNLCTMGFMFLVAFGLYGIMSLIRLEFASDGRNAAAPFRRRLSLSYSDSEPCPAIDYGLAFSGLAFDVLFVLIARHVVDVMGRHPCLAGLAAFAGGGLLFLCIPEYFPWAKGAPMNLIICMMSLARGGLTTAVWLTLVYAAETHGDASRSVWKSRRRVDGVEDDATIQHERAVKF